MRYAKYRLVTDLQTNLANGPSMEEIKLHTFASDNEGWHFGWTEENKTFSDFSTYSMSEITQEEAFSVYSQYTTNPIILDDGSFGKSADEEYVEQTQEDLIAFFS